MIKNSKNIIANIELLIVTIIWGGSFVSSKLGLISKEWDYGK